MFSERPQSITYTGLICEKESILKECLTFEREEFFLDLLHDLEEDKTISAAVIKEKLLITASCKGAVKANWPVTEIEMRTLLHDLSQVDNAHTCPHGRPIIYKITMQELYKIFKRGTYHG